MKKKTITNKVDKEEKKENENLKNEKQSAQ